MRRAGFGRNPEGAPFKDKQLTTGNKVALQAGLGNVEIEFYATEKSELTYEEVYKRVTGESLEAPGDAPDATSTASFPTVRGGIKQHYNKEGELIDVCYSSTKY